MSKAHLRKPLPAASPASEYCLTDFKTFKVMPKINSKEIDLFVYKLEISSLNRQVLEEFHRRYLLGFVSAGPPTGR